MKDNYEHNAEFFVCYYKAYFVDANCQQMAQLYLALSQKIDLTSADLQEFLLLLEGYHNECGGSGWLDLRLHTEGWIKYLEGKAA